MGLTVVRASSLLAGALTRAVNLGSRLFTRSPYSFGLRLYTRLHLEGQRPLDHVGDLSLREVELRVAHGKWAAGTMGTIVDAFGEDATVEIMDDEGRTLDLLTLRYEDFKILDRLEQEHLAL